MTRPRRATKKDPSRYGDLSRYEDVLGQLPMLQVYTHILLLFSMPEGVTRDDIVSDLISAVALIREKVPWMAGKVINVDKSPGNSGRYVVVPCPAPDRLIEVKDVSHELPPYQEIQRLKAPNYLLDSSLLAPTTAFPQRFEDSEEDPSRVIRLQAIFVEGGVLIDFATQHNMTDGGGVFGFARLVAQAMRAERFSDDLLEKINCDRRNVVPLLRPDEPMLDHSHYLLPPGTDVQLVECPEPAQWHVVRLAAAKVTDLKTQATPPPGESDPEVLFITGDDAISAFFWKKLTMMRQRRNTPDTRSRFSRAIDGRKVMGVPAEYMGDLVHNVATWLTFGELIDLPLHSIASHLRREMNLANTAYHVRSFATFIAQQPDKSIITYGGVFNPDTDVGMSSLSRADIMHLEFGILGRPDFVRRPNFSGNVVPGLLYIFPMQPEGDLDMLVCLTDADMEALRHDPEWNHVVEYIG
ncbi:trichothecene 3-O-acetyltransferase [Aspergillus costaricaensis CBS 115574]|uniref:Trichothecene 3-O-acetyltransferase n=1 Tax=Aspergillus costaricaensis CBS 115574 TaxID=1448317 RepID=A0ACD1IKM4_9EURO|nr:trichothecene 3-O-acetyltransferase [Aspergillus costaricaensis CBS 115574]RAK90954.1 trichothecene 3-O-acetyltransferase [Aspergillus costaricaensis CBS 115574]